MAKISDADERFVRQKYYELFLEKARFTATQHAEYGKWMIATLSVIHSGAIYLISTTDMAQSPQYWFALASFAGLVTALLAGWAAWWNWALFRDFYVARADPRSIVDDTVSIPTTASDWKYNISFRLAVALSAVSVLIIVAEWVAFAFHA